MEERALTNKQPREFCRRYENLSTTLSERYSTGNIIRESQFALLAISCKSVRRPAPVYLINTLGATGTNQYLPADAQCRCYTATALDGKLITDAHASVRYTEEVRGPLTKASQHMRYCARHEYLLSVICVSRL